MISISFSLPYLSFPFVSLFHFVLFILYRNGMVLSQDPHMGTVDRRPRTFYTHGFPYIHRYIISGGTDRAAADTRWSRRTSNLALEGDAKNIPSDPHSIRTSEASRYRMGVVIPAQG